MVQKNFILEHYKNGAVPTKDDEPFIAAHEVTVDENNTENSTFRFFVSSKLLLRQAINVSKFHTDATYKLLCQGFPVLVMDTTDLDRKFHPFGASVSTNEKAADFSFIFRALKEKVFELYGESLQPDVLICDAAFIIHNGFKENFPLCDGIIMCWAHLRRVVAKHILRYLKTAKQQNEFLCKFAFVLFLFHSVCLILNDCLYFLTTTNAIFVLFTLSVDLDKLQLAQNNDIFNAASELFLLKWKNISEDLATYFEKEWLILHPN